VRRVRGAFERPPFGPGYGEEASLRDVIRLEVWGTSVDDAGEDFCCFQLVRADGTKPPARRVDGY
jgi:hypothetical protein